MIIGINDHRVGVNMNDTEAKVIPFYCPKCGEETKAELLGECLYADPHEPTIKCPNCESAYRIELFELPG